MKEEITMLNNRDTCLNPPAYLDKRCDSSECHYWQVCSYENKGTAYKVK